MSARSGFKPLGRDYDKCRRFHRSDKPYYPRRFRKILKRILDRWDEIDGGNDCTTR